MSNDTFGKRFKALRKEKKLTQEKLAKIFYLNTSSISKYEKDRSIPEIALLIQISDFFNVSLDYLLCCTNSRARIHPEKTGPVWIDSSGNAHPFSDDEKEMMNSLHGISPYDRKEIMNYIQFKSQGVSSIQL